MVSADLLAPWQGPGAGQRVANLRRDLAMAVDRWWRSEELPGNGLLADGLLALEGGHKLDETQRTLLAHTALARGHGTLTALRHLNDPERAAGLMHEVLLQRLRSPDDLRRWLAEDPQSRLWAPLLATEVRADLASPLPGVADRAEEILQVLAAASPANAGGGVVSAAAGTVTVDDLPQRRGHWRPVLAAFLLVTLVALLVWAMALRTPAATVSVPEGLYSVSAEDGTRVSVRLDSFLIDRTELTNGAWAACVARGGCLPPEPVSSATRAGYYGEPAFNNHPVVNVTQSEAAAYCALQGKRLPTAAEWEVAATLAPATQRLWRYPWGEAFAPSLVVGSDSHEDTAPVRSRSTRGDSPLGAADMAGNVAEWTATPTGAQPDQPLTLPLVETGPALDSAPLPNEPPRDPLAPGYIVKGGSFRSAATDLLPSSSPSEPATTRANWLGFRCASTPPR